MINVIIPIVDKKYKYKDILSDLAHLDEVNVFIGIREELFNTVIEETENVENFNVTVFNNYSTMEGIINALQVHVGVGSTMIMRKPIKISEFNKFIASKKDVVTCRRSQNKFQSFLFAIWQHMLKFFLGLKMYEGDTSVIYLGQDLSSVISESGNLSFSTRANRWRGIEQETILVAGEPVKQDIDKKSLLIYLIIMLSALIVGVVVTVCLSVFVTINMIIGLLIVCLDLICLAIIIMTLVITIFNKFVGKKNVEEAALENVEYVFEGDE